MFSDAARFSTVGPTTITSFPRLFPSLEAVLVLTEHPNLVDS